MDRCFIRPYSTHRLGSEQNSSYCSGVSECKNCSYMMVACAWPVGPDVLLKKHNAVPDGVLAITPTPVPRAKLSGAAARPTCAGRTFESEPQVFVADDARPNCPATVPTALIATEQTYVVLPDADGTMTVSVDCVVAAIVTDNDFVQIIGFAAPPALYPCASIFAGAGDTAVAYGAGEAHSAAATEAAGQGVAPNGVGC